MQRALPSSSVNASAKDPSGREREEQRVRVAARQSGGSANTGSGRGVSRGSRSAEDILLVRSALESYRKRLRRDDSSEENRPSRRPSRRAEMRYAVLGILRRRFNEGGGGSGSGGGRRREEEEEEGRRLAALAAFIESRLFRERRASGGIEYDASAPPVPAQMLEGRILEHASSLYERALAGRQRRRRRRWQHEWSDDSAAADASAAATAPATAMAASSPSASSSSSCSSQEEQEDEEQEGAGKKSEGMMTKKTTTARTELPPWEEYGHPALEMMSIRAALVRHRRLGQMQTQRPQSRGALAAVPPPAPYAAEAAARKKSVPTRTPHHCRSDVVEQAKKPPAYTAVAPTGLSLAKLSKQKARELAAKMNEAGSSPSSSSSSCSSLEAKSVATAERRRRAKRRSFSSRCA